jgi:uncharacterized membrane protein
MSTVAIGAVIGAVLAVAALQFGFWGFVLVVVFALVGGLVGGFVSGKIDLRALVDVLTGRRSAR